MNNVENVTDNVIICIRYESEPYEEIVQAPAGMDLNEACVKTDQLLMEYLEAFDYDGDKCFAPIDYLVEHGFNVPCWGRAEVEI